METSATFSNMILNKLASTFCHFWTLAELTDYIISDSNIAEIYGEQISLQRINEAKILEVLIQLEFEGNVFLNPITDESCITIKGLLKINNKILLN
ncbi:hypothetical protein C8C83_3796 [Flavobacterium sp. 90]|uniref:hypothetical protein n=1 Tax=unclassified Flavobacterium TaxID=196869 RepID=UPI000F2AEC15|nr:MULTISPECIES: hypothetical protein [unclassified Flavobacterium]RKR12028.1 hypothetical protein C8C82_4116 [Flavobacterium sp. 81]TCK55800.1 hypothetical protein C8C83_3796 [Flavobacterium sp. 90]